MKSCFDYRFINLNPQIKINGLRYSPLSPKLHLLSLFLIAKKYHIKNNNKVYSVSMNAC